MERFGGLRALGAVLIAMSAGCRPVPTPRLALVSAAEHGPEERDAARADVDGVHIVVRAKERPGSVFRYRSPIPVRVAIDTPSARRRKIRLAERFG